ncbi:MAG: aminotransferase class IV, partial [Vicinamibacteria bacterium]
MHCYAAGKFVEESDARISVLDSSFREGVGVFETLRTYADRVPTLPLHVARLRKSAAFARLEIPESDMKNLDSILAELIRLSGGEEADRGSPRAPDRSARIQISRDLGDGLTGLSVILRPLPEGYD